MRTVLTAACAAFFLFAAGAAAAPAANDYTKPENWVCRPGQEESCAQPLDATIVAANGDLSIEKFTPDPAAPVDCFYVYPTVSLDPWGNSDMIPGREEKRVSYFQAGRFATHCRLFVPLYRQTTLTALRAFMTGAPMPTDEALAYGDVRDAWHDYLQRDNGGRGIVLIGHSQGAMLLARLIREEIDGKPLQKRLVSALLLGTSIAVPPGKTKGGAFQSIPLCRKPGQFGCVITYASFRAASPPPANALFGRVKQPGMVSSCTNPADLTHGGPAPLDSYLLAQGTRNGAGAPPQPWVTPEKPIATTFVKVPGLVTASCASTAGAVYLAIRVNGDPQDPRADEIAGDMSAGGKALPEWGLHFIDTNLAMGDLVRLVGEQSKSWRKTPH